ncbi:putative hydrolase [Anaerobranca californiensis DSM 14826]|uniref:Putative hydrolase n=1 Tax=Anaerobranca californiensis DSM 14826 TaxID=1120989 RepID=A0A1M6QN39_9FIRM|nr:PHP domain-containing protein [Anaerobranca californiensis]SHK21664.1 putative hydrolase [Anaerobranca californiensis DSM 14826]
MKIIGDYHTHTKYSHGKGTIEENVVMAIKRGLKEIGIAEHGPRVLFVGVSEKKLHKIADEIENLRTKYKEIKILFNIEANLIDIHGNIDVPPSILPRLDMLLVGFHPNILPTYHYLPLAYNNFLASFSSHNLEKARKLNTMALVNAVNKYKIDIITHPGHRIHIDTGLLAKACANRNTALEINCRQGEKIKDFVEVALKEGVKFYINSDAHKPEDVGNFEEGIEIAKKLNIPKEFIVNSN